MAEHLTDVHAQSAVITMQACKALGFRQDDLVATSDVIAGKNIAATCSALWSVASACVARSYKVQRPSDWRVRAYQMSQAHYDGPDVSLARTYVLGPTRRAGLLHVLSGDAVHVQLA